MNLPTRERSLSGSCRIVLFIWGLTFLVLASAIPGRLNAQGNLLILPRRVVFEGAQKSQALTLANTGADTAKFLISIVQMKMKEDGSFDPIDKPDSGQFFADKYLRFYPRTVTLAPNKTQVVKMQFMKPPDIAPGEYRSHVYFRAVPKSKPLGEKDDIVDTASVTAKLIAVFGITIPVIIRVGEPSTKVSMQDLSFEMSKDTVPKLKLTFHREGNFSCFGDLVVKHISPSGKETKAATVKGIAVYTPNRIRRFQCNLDRIPGVDYSSGKLVAVYTTPSDAKPVKIAEAEMDLKK